MPPALYVVTVADDHHVHGVARLPGEFVGLARYDPDAPTVTDT